MTAKEHQILPLIYYGALNCGFDSNISQMQQLFINTCSAISYNENQSYEIRYLSKAFDEEKIDYMPLKGIVMKQLYPKPEMRVMSDADILIRTEQYNKIAPLMERMGYTFKYESEHELVWKKNRMTVELHKRIISLRNQDFYNYFGDGWNFAKLKSGCCYEMLPEDFYIFLFIHFVKHYRAGGIGIKHMTDLWVYRNAFKVDDNYIENKLKVLGVTEFHSNIKKTLDIWFNSCDSDELSDFITGVIFNSGAYGRSSDTAVARLTKNAKKRGSLKKAKLYRVFWLIFPDFNWMSQKYTILKKAPFLLPFCWAVRWIKAMSGDKRNIKFSVEQLKNGTDEKIAEYEKSLKYVGLSFDLDEKQDMRV